MTLRDLDLFHVVIQMQQLLKIFYCVLSVLTSIHVASSFDYTLNNQQTLLLSSVADHAPDQLLFTPSDRHEGRIVDTVNAFFDHKQPFSLVECFECEAVPQKEVVPLAIEEPFRLILLVRKYRIFTANLVLDVESVDLRIPILVRLRDSSEDHRKTTPECYEYLYGPINLIQAVLFFALEQIAPYWRFTEMSEV